MVGLCYDTPSGEAMPFLLGLPDTFPRALSSDCSQDTCPSQPLGERLRRNNRLLEACIEGKSPHSTQFSGGARHCSVKSPGGEDLEIQEPIPRGDCAAFHFDPTLPGMLGSTLIRDQVVEVR